MKIFLKNLTGQNKLFYPALFFSSLLLLIPAFYNGYPLVNPDTGTYLASGFKLETPFDRPITYGLIIRFFSLNGLSLWLLVFTQAYIVSWLLLKMIKHLTDGGPYILKALLTIFILSACSSLSWIVSQVQPDVFTPVAFLCTILILMDKESKMTTIFLCLLFFVAVACHLSHPALFTATLLCLLILKRFFSAKGMYRETNKKICILIILSISGIAMMGSALAKSKHVFFTGSLLEKGILKKYLDDNCATGNYRLCAYKDSLPASADYFWWNSNSPLYKTGDWQGTKNEYSAIIHGVLTTPEYLKLFLVASGKQAMEQAVCFKIGDGNTSFPAGSNVNQRIAAYFPGELGSFNDAKQNAESLRRALSVANTIYTTVIILSLLVFAIIYVSGREMSTGMKLVFIICSLGIVLNCLDCAAFGTVNGRYGCKMAWLIPFCTIAYLISGKPANAK